MRTTLAPIALAAALLAACVVPPPRYPIRESDVMLATLRAREQRFHALRATGSADQFGTQGRVRGSVVVFVQRPDHLHVDTFALGHLVSSLVSDGQTFALLQGDHYYAGPARACVAARLLGIPLAASDVVTVLTGGATVLGTPSATPTWEEGRYVITSRTSDGAVQTLAFALGANEHDLPAAQQHPRLARVRVSDAQGVRIEVSYDGYRVVNGIDFPDRVHLVMPHDHVDTVIGFEQLNPDYVIPPDPDFPGEPPPDPFRATPPAGIHVEPVDC